MLQRIQTLFLALVCVGMGVCLLAPSWQKSAPTDRATAALTAFALTHERAGVVTTMPAFYIAILAVLVAGVAGYSISQYHNRLMQMRLGALNSLLMAGLLGCILYFSTRVGDPLLAGQPDSSFGNYQAGFFGVLLAVISNLLANRFIRRDDQLVRAADRMR